MIACARCSRYAHHSREKMIERYGPNTNTGELAYLVAADSGCKWATKEHRDAYNFSPIKCDVLRVSQERWYEGLKADIKGGWGFRPSH